MKTKLIWVSVTFAVCLFATAALYFFADKINHRRNGFIRLFPPHPILPDGNFDIKYDSYYIAGFSGSNIYLGNFVAPLRVLSADMGLSDTAKLKINVDHLNILKLRRPLLSIDSPNFYLTDGIRPAILRGKIGEWKASRYMYDSTFFTDAIPLNSNSFIVRSVSRDKQNLIGKVSRVKPHVKFETEILKKQVDGLFCTDGMLNYNKDLNMLVFVYYYRNQYITMDTSLIVLAYGNTIDTISQAKIKVGRYNSGHAITMASPPLLVNKKSCVYRDYLLVNSDLLANNENKELFDRAPVIDVYNLRDRKYKFSFYLFGDGQFSDFKISNDQIVALFGHHLFTYKLVPKFFP